MTKGTNKNAIRIILVVLLIAVGAAVAFGVLPSLYKMEGATIQVIMLKENIKEGTKINDEMLVSTTVGAYGLSSTVITDSTTIVGKYATQDISSKDLLFPEKFQDTIPSASAGLDTSEIEVAEDEMLLTLQLSSVAAGAAGNILPGDKVNVAVYFNPNQFEDEYDSMGQLIKPDTTVFPEDLQNMTVYRVQTAQLTGVDPNCDLSTSSTNDRIPTYITLVCTKAQADLLIDYSYTNTVHFVEVD